MDGFADAELPGVGAGLEGRGVGVGIGGRVHESVEAKGLEREGVADVADNEGVPEEGGRGGGGVGEGIEEKTAGSVKATILTELAQPGPESGFLRWLRVFMRRPRILWSLLILKLLWLCSSEEGTVVVGRRLLPGRSNSREAEGGTVERRVGRGHDVRFDLLLPFMFLFMRL